MTENPAPSLSTIARLVEQSIEEQRDTRARLDAHIEVTTAQHVSLASLMENVRNAANAQFLTLAGELSSTRKHVLQIEEHVGFLTTKVVDHDKRFDQIDERFDAVDKRLDDHDARFDGIDKRFDEHDARFDAVDKRFDDHDARFDAVDKRFDEHDARFDGVDRRLDALTGMVEQIRDAVV